jgi:hypothetical protein
MDVRQHVKSRKRYVGQPSAAPMPGGPEKIETSPRTSAGTAPPAEMRDRSAAGRADLAIDAMEGYPGGRGGMNKVPMPTATESTSVGAITPRPSVPIGRQPPATKMP